MRRTVAQSFKIQLKSPISISVQAVQPKTTGKVRVLRFPVNASLRRKEHLIRHYKVPGVALHQPDHEQAADAFLKHTAAFEQATMNPACLRTAMTGGLAEQSVSTNMQYAEFIRKTRQERSYETDQA